MQATLFALLTGLLVGLIFSFLKLPLPAPNVLPGIAGIVGIYLGGQIFQYIMKLIGK
ncbi:DUF1427 family protein [Thermoanaerobacterium sp. RBIITD]|uniref:XapX domain-containing protein n=1 Tax=Thermoanaerobacterium sp. RBIITD TaxID=1550240 RepID=UPI000BB7AA54|nr:DUF1427 family protein [Thermoanaerobacterium sp. RBIITD]SNX53739.1 XapX domain-containing protein [Thermoanaerobacterium sp. RBIITD]